jgi:hypothetical protein
MSPSPAPDAKQPSIGLSAVAVIGIGILVVLGGGAFLLWDNLRPLTSANDVVARFWKAARESGDVSLLACPPAYDPKLLAAAMKSPELTCDALQLRVHASGVAAAQSNPRWEVECRELRGARTRKIELSLLTVDGGVCGPGNGGFVVSEIVTWGFDSPVQHDAFKMPAAARRTIFGH